MYSDEELARLAPLMGTTYPWTDTGIMILRAYSEEPGVVFDVVGQSNRAVLLRRWRHAEHRARCHDRRTGGAASPMLQKDEYQVEFIDSQALCGAFTAWPGDMDNQRQGARSRQATSATQA